MIPPKSKTMKKQLFNLFSFLILLSISYNANSQTAAGVRLGSPLSISLKHFINDSHALEAYVGTRGSFGYRWYTISGAYQIHKPLLEDEIEGLQYYFGGGASVLFWTFDFGGEGFSSTTFAAQGYLGLNYVFEKVPINVSVDWIPTVLLGNGFTTGFGAGYGSLGVRYVFSK